MNELILWGPWVFTSVLLVLIALALLFWFGSLMSEWNFVAKKCVDSFTPAPPRKKQ
jgi:hypothetical protein